ncbi:hypothetical protein [Arthrobacter glacialis]|uniref:Polysaccharide chain length determinant N-terminal domain-containing protein n=1 Tax=Arthrobacter glacialis TaxID=1664 RepID=A0A2S4A0T3_ARTGL|nr:hypothetical protein [Arthrobacter glacialis]POH60682.1 hypothetical protein CVS28_03165 [Arthrobacter glacialis]POH74889.1 hypothetical protein CVS27_03220 [Arthrobacter glacialis]
MRAIQHHWISAVAVLTIGVLVAIGFLAQGKPAYSSTSIVFLDPLSGNPFSPTTPASRTEQLAALTTEAGLVYTDAVIEAAVAIGASTGTALGPEMRSDILTEVPSNSTVVQITYTQPNARLAQAGAQALAEAYLAYRRDRAARVVAAQTELRKQQQTSIEQLLAEASNRLNAAKILNVDQAQILDLQQQVTLYATHLATVNVDQTGANATSITPGDIISPASLPVTKDGVNPLLIALAIVLVAAAFAVMVVLARENLDQKIREPEDIVSAGVEPFRGSIRRWSSKDAPVVDMEGLRQVANVIAASEPSKKNVLFLAGTPAGTDTFSIASGLAAAFDEIGTTTVVVGTAESDGGETGTGAKVLGLTDILAGDAPLADCWDLLKTDGNHSTLPVGTQAELLATLVQGPRLTTVFKALSEKALVIVAGPSLDSGAGIAMARHAREVLLVVDGGTASVADLARAKGTLLQIHVELAGAILYKRPSRKAIRLRRRPAAAATDAAEGPTDTPQSADDAAGSASLEVVHERRG